MKVIKHLNNYWVSYIILLLIGFLIFLVYGQKKVSNPNYEIKVLEQNIKLLEIENNELIRKSDSLKLAFAATEKSMSALRHRDSLLKIKSDSLTLKMNHIKLQYEKAITKVEHFNNDSLRKYFSDLNY